VLGLFQPAWKDPLQKVQQDIAVLQSEKDVTQINKQIHDLQDQIKSLQQKTPASSPPSKP
jgi:peptidoglycan hydrolase CwlO-like protein